VTTNNDAVQFSISTFTAPDSLLWEYSTYNPVATLTISHRQIPNISVSVKPEKAEYWSGSGQINWTVELKNNGGMDLSDVSLSYQNHDDIRIEVIKKDESVSKYLNEDIPVVRENTTLKFNVNIHFDMVISSEIETFQYTGSGTVIINPQRENIYLTKIIKSRTPTEDNTSFKSRIYTEDNTVTVSLANSGIYPISYIVVTDRYKSSGILHTWKLDRLPPGKSITFSYIVKPSQTGDFTSPASFANFMINGNFRDISSNTVDVTVISMGKSIPISPDENYTEPIPTSIPTSQDEVYTEPIPTSIPIFPDEVFTELTPIQTIAPIQPLPTIQPIPTTPGFSWVAGIMLLFAASLKRQEGSI
jgi:hypothetical protein